MMLDDTEKMLKKIGRVGGWAPGNYMGRCGECKEEFTGDKRALFCLPCAIAMHTREVAVLSGVFDAAEKVCSMIEEDCPNYWKSLWKANSALRSALSKAKGGAA